MLTLCKLCRIPIETADDCAWEPVEPARADGYARSVHVACFARAVERRHPAVAGGIQRDIDTEQQDLTLRSLGPDARLKPDDGEDLVPV